MPKPTTSLRSLLAVFSGNTRVSPAPRGARVRDRGQDFLRAIGENPPDRSLLRRSHRHDRRTVAHRYERFLIPFHEPTPQLDPVRPVVGC